jgi:hypothetical protein
MSKLKPLGPPPNPLVDIRTPCITYNGPLNSDYYTVFNVSNKELGYKIKTYGHIVAYLLLVGERGLEQVQHLCGVRWCVNQNHLTLGNAPENGQHASKTRAQSKPDQQSWKLSEPDRIMIRRLYWIESRTVQDIAEMYEVTKSTVYRILEL